MMPERMNMPNPGTMPCRTGMPDRAGMPDRGMMPGMMPGMNCSMMLQRVYEAGFAMDDAVLYLDTHPGDRDALSYYHYAAGLYKQAMDAYEAQCGPLRFDAVPAEDYWTWVNGPWPWEGVCG